MATPVEFNEHGNVTVESNVLLAPVATQRALTKKRLERELTEEEILGIVTQRKGDYSSDKYKEVIEEAKPEDSVHRFTELQDAFIRNNYQYMSDNTIALALKVPYSKVQQRRRYLGLKKQQPPADTMVIIWDNRDKFDEVLKNGWTELRPGLC